MDATFQSNIAVKEEVSARRAAVKDCWDETTRRDRIQQAIQKQAWLACLLKRDDTASVAVA